jgi:ribosome-associated protein
MESTALANLAQSVLEDRKGQDIVILDVREKTSFTDFMIVVTGTSDRHLKSLCEYVAMSAKENGVMPWGMEGDLGSDWILLDLGDVIVHAMTGKAREHYSLEKLWSVSLPLSATA